jgi:hypothetical protein
MFVFNQLFMNYLHTFKVRSETDMLIPTRKRQPLQGCQMVCFQTKNPNLDKFWRVLLWKILVYFITIWYILRPLERFYGRLVYFVVIWYIFPRFGILDQEKSGNPEPLDYFKSPKVGDRFCAKICVPKLMKIKCKLLNLGFIAFRCNYIQELSYHCRTKFCKNYCTKMCLIFLSNSEHFGDK